MSRRALADKDFLYRQRVWFLRRHASICTGCSVGCSIWVEENQDHIYRLKPRENLLVNKWWICNEGRYGYHHVHDRRRLVCRAGGKSRRRGAPLDWTGLAEQLRERLRAAGRLAGVISPYLSVEEAYMLCKLLRQIDPEAMLVAGPVPSVGEDERFPGRFVIAAEKCPNRCGIEAILAHFTQRVDTLEQLLPVLDRGEIGGAWVAGGYKSRLDRRRHRAAVRAACRCLVVQDLFPSPLAELATYELPGAAFAERDGSYVNRNDRLQTVEWAIRPPAGVRPEGELYWELLGGSGLYRLRGVLDELAREILYFSAAVTPIPDVGLDLKINSSPRVQRIGGRKMEG